MRFEVCSCADCSVLLSIMLVLKAVKNEGGCLLTSLGNITDDVERTVRLVLLRICAAFSVSFLITQIEACMLVVIYFCFSLTTGSEQQAFGRLDIHSSH